MSERLHTCRRPGPCWGCEGEIGIGEYYRSIVTWHKGGPCRTRRMHPSCHDELSMMSPDDARSFCPGDLNPPEPKEVKL